MAVAIIGPAVAPPHTFQAVSGGSERSVTGPKEPIVPEEPSLEAVSAQLYDILVEARQHGFLGPGPVERHVAHAWPLVERLPDAGLGIDLGSGGGIPGLVLALGRPGLAWTLVDSQERRSTWLAEAVRRLGLGSVSVRWERAEVTGRSALRHTAVAVVARSFGPPAVTAECGAPLLTESGTLWVAEPPDRTESRWPRDVMTELGLQAPGIEAGGWAGFPSVAPCPERYPRRVGIPAKRPLFL